ncbi:TPA: hypothetical protein DEX28_02170 [Patescibacteria group bacterium]|nr:hypothetical protein [Patescibacteria group bacterium]
MAIILSILIISFLILIHELGHFLAAKKAGMAVEEFGLGLPPRLFGKKINGTIYSLNLILFGGFVRIKGESDSQNKNDADSFASQAPGKKIIVVLAGILMNFFVGFLIFWGLFAFGNEIAVDSANKDFAKNLKIGILEVAKGSPAETVGIKPGDRVLSFKNSNNETGLLSQQGFIDFAKQNAGENIFIEIEGRGQVNVVPRESPPQGQGPLGVAIVEIGFVKYPFFKAFTEALKHSLSASVYMFEAAGKVLENAFFKGDISNISGPVGIVNMTASSIGSGLGQTLGFMALISLNLAVFNLLPLPALDGGRLVFVLWEALTRKPVPQKYETWIHSIGMVLLLGLLLLVTVGDIRRLF